MVYLYSDDPYHNQNVGLVKLGLTLYTQSTIYNKLLNIFEDFKSKFIRMLVVIAFSSDPKK